MKIRILLALIVLIFAFGPAYAEPVPGTTQTAEATKKKRKKKKRRKGKKKAKKVEPEAEAAQETDGDQGGSPSLQRSNRMEFDGRLVKGERAAGAVYLFKRTPRPLPPLLRFERDVLNRIVWPVLRRPADAVAETKE